MNVGPGDIVKGFEVALTIYRLGFVQENAADKRYQDFREEINDFQSLLRKLNSSILEAERRYQSRGPTLGVRSYSPLSEDFEKERKALVGPFNRTLEDCEKLLEANKDYRAKAGRHSSAVQNLRWHLSQNELKVDDLRRRLQFHSEKIRFVIDRLSLGLLTDLDAKADDLLAMAEQNLAVSDEIRLELSRFRSSLFGFLSGQGGLENPSSDSPHVISDTIAARFQESVTLDAPTVGSNEMPLIQGFDALLLHFQRLVGSSDQAAEHYLLFLKIQWLLTNIKKSHEYREARPGFYYKRAVNQIENAISTRTRRPADLVQYDEAVLMELPDASFRIWPLPTVAQLERNRHLEQLVPRANEQEVARIELASDGPGNVASVTIFKRSHEQFRVVQQVFSSISNEKTIIPHQIDTSEDKLIPRYALPTLENPCLEIAIFSRNEENLYTFPSLSDLWRFQTAFTGYEVSFDHTDSNIRCQFSEDVKSLDCVARVQIWQDPIVLGPAAESTGVTIPNSPTTFSGESKSHHETFVASIAPTTNLSRTPDGWQAEPPKSSALAFFTQLTVGDSKRFAAIFMELQDGISIRPSECKCHLNYDQCSKLVLARHDKKKIQLQVHLSAADPEGRPDPNTFDIFPFRVNRGSRPKKMSTKQTEYVVLKFNTLEEKRRFHKELDLRYRIRDKQITEQRKFRREIEHRQNHPERHDRIIAPPKPRSSSLQTVVAIPIPAPQIQLPDTGPTLGEAFTFSSMSGSARRRSDKTDYTSLSTSPSTIDSSATPLSATTSIDDSPFDSGTNFDRIEPRRPSGASSRTTSRWTGIRNSVAKAIAKEQKI